MIRSLLPIPAAFLFLLILISSLPATPVTPGIEELVRLDALAQFKTSTRVASISSYDRTGGNDDGFSGRYSFVHKEDDGLVLADLQGPGVLYRLWTPTPTDDVMAFYFDGEATPRIQVKFRELFMGTHPVFPRPLVGYGAGGFYSYVPLPYKKSLKVKILAEQMQFYQINYASYPDAAGIETFSTQPSPEQNEWTEKAKALIGSTGSDISAYVAPQGKTIERVKTSGRLTAQNPLPFFQTETPGRVVGIRLSPASALAGKERAIVLRAYWDGDSLPAILAPAGDFFGYAWGEPAAQSLLFGTEGDTNYCYFPMPFDQSARIELVLEGESNSVVPIEAEVLFCPEPRQANEGKFYSLWRRENPTTAGKPFTFIETQGRGHLVGVTQQAQGLETGQTPFFEGDDQTTIDGELVIHGTGSEDFYNGGWYDVPGRWETRRSFPFSGCLGYKKYLGRTGAYRIFLGDAYAYRHSLLQTIEHAPTNNDILNDYCGMVYLYSEARPTGAFTLPAVADRAVVDPTRIVFAASWNVPIYSFSLQNAQLSKQAEKIGDQNIRYFSMKAKDKAVFGDHSIGFICEIPAAGQYKISLDTVKGPSGAKIQLFLDEVAIGPEVDLYRAEKQRASDDYVGTMKLEEGPNVLMFKLVGKNDASSGLDFDLCNIICEKME